MQIKPALLLAACLDVFLSPAIAATLAPVSASPSDDFVPPAPLSVVVPIRAPAGYENATVKVQFVVDAHGVPHCIDVLGLVPTEARELVIAAVRQWQFSPATRHGTPVSVRVILPLPLAVGD